MNAESLLTCIQKRGVHLAVIDGKLEVDAPQGVLTPGLVGQVRKHKKELIEHIRRDGRCGAIHISPAQWAHRRGPAYCPRCDRFMGYLK